MTTFWPKRDKDGRHIVEQPRADVAEDLKCAKCKGHIRYYTFDYTKGVYVTNYCEHV